MWEVGGGGESEFSGVCSLINLNCPVILCALQHNACCHWVSLRYCSFHSVFAFWMKNKLRNRMETIAKTFTFNTQMCAECGMRVNETKNGAGERGEWNNRTTFYVLREKMARMSFLNVCDTRSCFRNMVGRVLMAFRAHTHTHTVHT